MSARKPIHFLHVGKTAGTEIRRYLKVLAQRLQQTHFVVHGHDTGLKDLPAGEDYLFSIRDPISRFRSGFYSRKRKGQPLTFSEWTAHDAQAFADFEHANDLAEALFREDVAGMKAFCAMKSIRHTAQNQSDWIDLCGYFLSIRPPLAIIRQEHFAEDMRYLQYRLGLREPVVVERDKVKSHENDYGGTPVLSELARANLQKWYAQDHEFYRICNAWIASHQKMPEMRRAQ